MSIPYLNPRDIRHGTVGIPFVLTVKNPATKAARDISGAVSQWLVFRKPSGKVVTIASTFTTDGTDGKAQAAATEDLLDEVGEYLTWVRYRDGTERWDSSPARFNCVQVR